MKNIFFILASFLFPALLFAQHTDSSAAPARSPVTEYFTEKNFFPGNSVFQSVDTSMDGIQRYLPAGERLFQRNFSYSLGLMNRQLLFKPDVEIGFRSGLENLDLFGYNTKEMKYYRTRTPYTEVFALFGVKKEQYTRLLHTQNITKRWNIALNMLRMRNGDGFYQKQICTDNNISLSSNYLSRNNRYSLLANGYVSSVKTEENGGIRNDEDFESDLFGNKKLVAVNLLNARTKRITRGLYVRQFLNFGRKEAMPGDSTRHLVHPKHALSYSLHVNASAYLYADNPLDTGYYEHVFFDTLQTHDSTHILTFQHALSWKSFFTKDIAGEISFEQKSSHLVRYKTDSLLAADTLFSDNILHCSVGKTIREDRTNGLCWNLDGNYIVSGTNRGDHSSFAGLSYVFKGSKKISFEYAGAFHVVPFIYSLYSSNHFWWSNAFSRITESNFRLSYNDSKNKFILRVELSQLSGFVYFDSTFSPRQSDSSISIYSVFVQKDFRLGKFHFNNKITWQSIGTPSEQATADVIHLPSFVTNHSFYYQARWFKGVSLVQLGFDISYFSSYFADAYMPALGLYYLQDHKAIGNYPFIDLFFNMKVKRARIFFKTEHVNAGLMGAYYLAPHIPAPDRSIKLGINWTFFD